jgi:sigma-B regulation protein RsbU (phosphoserine phosphatase)
VDVDNSGHFMTLFVCEIDSHNGILRWIRAGHDPAMVYHIESDTFRELGGKGLPLGVVKDSRFEECTCPIEDQQILVIGTDGIWEAFDSGGNRFGKDKFKELIRSSAHLPADGMADRVIESVQHFSHPLKIEDDITLVIVKFDNKMGAEEGRRLPNVASA